MRARAAVDRRAHQALFLVAEAPGLAGVRVQPRHRHPRRRDAEAPRQRLGRQPDRRRDAVGGQQARRRRAARTCVVATVTRSVGPASIIANSRTPARDARYSVWPGNAKPARAIHCFEIGAVTRARDLARQRGGRRRGQVRELRPSRLVVRFARRDVAGAERR